MANDMAECPLSSLGLLGASTMLDPSVIIGNLRRDIGLIHPALVMEPAARVSHLSFSPLPLSPPLVPFCFLRTPYFFFLSLLALCFLLLGHIAYKKKDPLSNFLERRGRLDLEPWYG